MRGRRIVAAASVRCCGQIHRIELSERGALLLVNHKRDEAGNILDAVADEECRCRSVLKAWADPSSALGRWEAGKRARDIVPRQFLAYRTAACTAHRKREYERKYARFEEQSTLEDAISARIRVVLRGCGYTPPNDKRHLHIGVMDAMSRPVCGSGTTWIRVNVAADWLDSVWRRRLARVGRVLVLTAPELPADGTGRILVTALRQYGDGHVMACGAMYDVARHTITWVDEDQAGGE